MIEPIPQALSNYNISALSSFAGYLGFSTGLIAFVAKRIIHNPCPTLSKSQETELTSVSRKRNVRIFTGLAALSLIQTWYHLSRILAFSYRVWALEKNVPLPSWPYSLHTINELKFGQWLASTAPLADESWNIAVNSSQRYWWTQQLFLLSPAWALFVGIEGRRRRIPHLWSFVLLIPLVSRSFALNMFFLAILTNPPVTTAESKLDTSDNPPASKIISYLPADWHPTLERVIQFLPPNPSHPHPSNWHPHALGVILDLSTIFCFTWLLPYTLGTPSFKKLIAANLIVLFKAVYEDRLAPFAYGSTKRSAAEVSQNYSRIYRFLSLSSIALFVKQTVFTLLDNIPKSQHHIDTTYLSAIKVFISSAPSGIADILSRINEHPAMARLGYDVLLSATTLTIWTIIRGIDFNKIIYSTGLGIVFGIDSTSIDTNNEEPQPIEITNSTTLKPLLSIHQSEKEQPPSSRKKGRRPEGNRGWMFSLGSSVISLTAFLFGGLGLLASAVLGAEEI